MSRMRFILLGLVLTTCHLALAFGSLLYSFGASMDDFDRGVTSNSVFKSFVGYLCNVLWQPGHSLWTYWMSKNLPGADEWGMALLNSALWGFGLAFLIRILFRKKKNSVSQDAVSS